MQEFSLILISIELTLLLLAGLLVVMIYWVRKNYNNMKALKTLLLQQQELEEPERFNTEKAEQWFETGDLTALNHYCERFMNDSPNSVHANWYFGLSHYNQGDYEAARTYFEQVIRINPLWRDGAVVYLQEIADKIGLLHQKTLH